MEKQASNIRARRPLKKQIEAAADSGKTEAVPPGRSANSYASLPRPPDIAGTAQA
jgi:hypothetical protein